jgi:hypothetical protein
VVPTGRSSAGISSSRHSFQEEVQMRLMWSYGILLTVTGCVSAGQGIGGPGTYTYTDLLRPHGRARGEAAEQLATRICDHGNSDMIATAPFNACMRARGWRLTHYEPAPSPAVSFDSSPDYSSPPPPPPDISPPPPPQPFVSIGNPACPGDVCY